MDVGFEPKDIDAAFVLVMVWSVVAIVLAAWYLGRRAS